MCNWRSLYPFESHYLQLGEHRCHYIDEGEGPVLLMVHGNPTWSFYWRELIKALRGEYRIIAPDHVGCGLSDKPRPEHYSYRLRQRIDDLLRLIDELGLDEVTLVGHDWGGCIGMGAAVTVPDRFARFALLNTAAFRSERCPWPIWLSRAPVFGQWAVQGLNLFALGASRMAVYRHERITPEVRAGLLAPYDTWNHRTAVYQFVCDIPLSTNHPSYGTIEAIEAGLAQFQEHPVCLIWGMADWCFTPEYLDRFREYFPKAEAHRLQGAGHYVVEDAHERIVPLLGEFLKTHPLGSARKPH